MSKLNKKEQVVLSLSNIKTELDKLGLWSNGMNRPDDQLPLIPTLLFHGYHGISSMVRICAVSKNDGNCKFR